ncbi:hypothetical protein ES332_A11G290000v1 [Gossypium tomentosum]|uniref:Uncharacterized protein n=1 Tax=Gossypium tomentosum TaxID=34277 RepID=A0A5D2NFB6_GOSTO|nr:hypothetical protein ES332_A11G290000v1 [Gossypium tomentosum]
MFIPLPIFQQTPSIKIPFNAHKLEQLYHVYEQLFPSCEFKKSSFEKYFSLRTYAIKEFGCEK